MSPWARAVRTFTLAVGPILVGALALAQKGLENIELADLEPTAIGIVIAALAGLSAFVLAVKEKVATTPLGRAAAQALQVFGSGLVVLTIADLSAVVAVQVAWALGTLVAVSVLSGLLALTQVSAENG